MKMTSAFKFTACAVALALTSADTTLMASANPTTAAAPATTDATAPADIPADPAAVAADPPATNNSATIIPANSDAPGSLVANATAASEYGNFMKDYQDAVEAHKDEIAQWAQKFAQDHKELIADGMKMVQKLQADSAALSKDGTGNSTAVQEKVQKLRGAVQEQVKQYFADPEHEQQLDAIRDEVKALVAKHIPDVKVWVAKHKADVLAYLKKVTGDVEAGRIPPAYVQLEQMGITQPDAQAYMKEHGAEVEANMKKFEAAQDTFVKAHQQQILKVLGAATKMVETGEYHLPDEAKGALLNKWKGIQEDGGNDADADAGANAGAGADINTNTTTAYATPAPSSRRLRGRF
jgi:hypothetical protein